MYTLHKQKQKETAFILQATPHDFDCNVRRERTSSAFVERAEENFLFLIKIQNYFSCLNALFLSKSISIYVFYFCRKMRRRLPLLWLCIRTYTLSSCFAFAYIRKVSFVIILEKWNCIERKICSVKRKHKTLFGRSWEMQEGEKYEKAWIYILYIISSFKSLCKKKHRNSLHTNWAHTTWGHK